MLCSLGREYEAHREKDDSEHLHRLLKQWLCQGAAAASGIELLATEDGRLTRCGAGRRAGAVGARPDAGCGTAAGSGGDAQGKEQARHRCPRRHRPPGRGVLVSQQFRDPDAPRLLGICLAAEGVVVHPKRASKALVGMPTRLLVVD
jgi:hypothetical protein